MNPVVIWDVGRKTWPWVVGIFAATFVFLIAFVRRRPQRELALGTVEALVTPRLKQAVKTLEKAKAQETEDQERIDRLTADVYAVENDATKRMVETGHITAEEAVARLRALVRYG